MFSVKIMITGLALALIIVGPATAVASSYYGSGQQIYVPPSVGGRPGTNARSSFVCPTISEAASSVCSLNWSGYADTGSSGSVTAVSGSWMVPPVNCPARGTTYAAIWVGIDGYSSDTVEQTGIFAECNNGAASYAAWYEFYPSASVSISSSVVPVGPNDIITASVTYTAGVFTTTISSNGGQAFTYSASVSGAQRSSAEWIIERPELCSAFFCSLATLSNFGTASLSASSATINGSPFGISSLIDAAITMVSSSSGPILAEPSPVLDGTSFTVAYE